ncbi:MAG: PEP-CTERM sorting domain-containing protein [Desulfobacterales bacterium]|nr:MAG: PEP-CTERM sorting domain-containing protein [Desulfobacterales bacterium]
MFNGEVIESSSALPPDWDYDYFFVEYISGNLIANYTNQYSSAWQSPANDEDLFRWNFGIIMNPLQPVAVTSFTVGTIDSKLQFYMDSIDDSVSGINELLSLGIQFTTENTVRDVNGYVRFVSDVSVTQTSPVPEPSTILLVGSGLIGLAGFTRKKFKK